MTPALGCSLKTGRELGCFDTFVVLRGVSSPDGEEKASRLVRGALSRVCGRVDEETFGEFLASVEMEGLCCTILVTLARVDASDIRHFGERGVFGDSGGSDERGGVAVELRRFDGDALVAAKARARFLSALRDEVQLGDDVVVAGPPSFDDAWEPLFGPLPSPPNRTVDDVADPFLSTVERS